MGKKSQIVDMRRSKAGTKTSCWLVWSLQTSGLTQLRAVDKSSAVALRHVKGCRQENGVIKAWVEERDMDHLYGHADITSHAITNKAELRKLADELCSGGRP